MGTVVRSLRVAPPAHYATKFESFSSFVRKKIQKYESTSFEADGYKWSLWVYPGGRIAGKGHISLYLAIDNTKTLPIGWEVNVTFKMCVFDKTEDKYLTIQDANNKIWRFHDKKTEWGFDEALSLTSFNDVSNGYLVDDSCLFGVEVSVVNYANKGECVSSIEEPKSGASTWTISDLYALPDGENCSDDFDVGGYKWNLSIYPKGNGEPSGKYISFYLKLVDNLPPGEKLYVKYKLKLKNQRTRSGYYEKEGVPTWFSASSNSHGFTEFVLLDDLNYNGGFPNLSLLVEGQITVLSRVKKFP